MFPLRWNFPFRKRNGNMINLEDITGDVTKVFSYNTTQVSSNLLENLNETIYSVGTGIIFISGSVIAKETIPINSEVVINLIPLDFIPLNNAIGYALVYSYSGSPLSTATIFKNNTGGHLALIPSAEIPQNSTIYFSIIYQRKESVSYLN